MTGKEFMENIKSIKRKIRLLNEQIERDTILASSVGAIRYDKVTVQTSPVQDRMSDIVAKIIESTDELHREIRELQKQELIARQLLIQLPERYERILVMHFFDDMSWCLVADKMGYDEYYIHEMKNKAFDELTKLLNES